MPPREISANALRRRDVKTNTLPIETSLRKERSHALRRSAGEVRPEAGGVLTLSAMIAAGGAFAGTQTGNGSSVQIELWQVINLVGAPLLAVLFAQPVIDDVRAWLRTSRR